MRNRRACLLVLLGASVVWGAWSVFPAVGSKFSHYRDDWAERMGVEKGMPLDRVLDRLGTPEMILYPQRPPEPGEYPGLDAPIKGQVLVYRSFGLLGRAYIYFDERNRVRSWGGGPG